ncbi:hypothetical protein J2Y46_002636 [Microbacterium sp. BE35]|uniref:DUF6993 domain-containing protein n=1 Tax=Microbacterium sp. BE35 TaxID=2817773 RepID=UPI0028625CE6|nr:hypothetical protein [Microbacterium sp. BE35]MDR7189810.1 hypothetical protein [Microbacterium sp. BE35]
MARDLPPRARFDVRSLRAMRVIAALALVGALTACSPGEPEPEPEPTTTTTDGAPSPIASPTTPPEPTLVPEGTADDNLPLFSSVTAAVWATDARVTGRAYVDALTAAGFDKAAMQVTQDLSTVGNPAESIQFSVRWNDQCLVGQVGPATGDPVTVVVPVLAEGNCLVGQTRPIDW